MARNVYIMKPLGGPKHQALYNDTGATLAQYELSVIGELIGVVDDGAGIVSTGTGNFDIGMKVLRVLDADMQTSEKTFNTDNQIVYFDPTTKKFSDTETAGYYAVGQLVTKKGATGFMEFLTFERATLVTT